MRLPDPAGGPEWVLRSWRGRPDPRASFGSRPSEFVCDQLGVLEGGRLVQPPPAAPVVLQPGRESTAGEGGCNEARWLAKHPPVGEVVSFVNDPFAYSPVPLRTVVMGMVGRTGARSRSCSAPAPRARSRSIPTGCSWPCCPAATGTRTCGSSPPWTASAWPGSRCRASTGPPRSRSPRRGPPIPNGGPPWGFAVSGYDSAQGQIVDGRLVALEPQSGTLHAGPEGWGGGPPARGTATQAAAGPVRSAGRLRHRPCGRTRRILAAARWSAARCRAARSSPGAPTRDVAAVTIVTPRDVRTLRPSGPGHVLIAVYDGQFFSGRITATVLLRNGKTVTEQIRDFTNVQAEAPPEPSLASWLQSTRRQLRKWRGPRRGAGRIAEGYLLLAGSLRAIERRIAFIHAHPGVLPEG